MELPRPSASQDSAPAAAHPEPTLLSSLKATVFTNLYFNLLLIFIPFGFLAHYLNWDSSLSFVFNFIAIVGLAKMLDFVTDELSKRVPPSVAGLLNATFGNAVELIVSVLALKAGLIEVVRSSLLGSILSNLLLVLGFCFLFGGIWGNTGKGKGKAKVQKWGFNFAQKFNYKAANTSTSILAVTVLSYLLPAAFGANNSFLLTPKDPNSPYDPKTNPGIQIYDTLIQNVSHVAAIVLLLTYAAYLFFTLYTHIDFLNTDTYDDDVDASATQSKLLADEEANISSGGNNPGGDEEEEDEPRLITVFVAILILTITTVFIGFNAEFMVDSIDGDTGISKKWQLSETFIGLILIPIVGNAAEHVTAVSSAMRNKMDLAISVSIGSCLQMALFVSPLLVIVGWAINQPLTLVFDGFGTAAVFISVFVVNALITDGHSTWLEGFLLLASYAIIAVSAFYLQTNPAVTAMLGGSTV
ncbi:Sodium/calcium exchanger protein-domain-containing protein [Polychytrium aggregatum]|uniref:Sodium/calcium exchanger protein-domain-containing protein n=1 Tax=Polychytrium aggregatum TaxID=110093 RepID=UPI0022FF379A|nr:Sodium/calcium exchanger protein-domain-containing protein [Polychytrium aggregatum]KAI9206439.1 Sodium/calcium exchanger protein-domain-containing protein [Polychytrium aggregatum]